MTAASYIIRDGRMYDIYTDIQPRIVKSEMSLSCRNEAYPMNTSAYIITHFAYYQTIFDAQTAQVKCFSKSITLQSAVPNTIQKVGTVNTVECRYGKEAIGLCALQIINTNFLLDDKQ